MRPSPVLRLVNNESLDPKIRLAEALSQRSRGLEHIDARALQERVVRSAPADADYGVLRELLIHTAAGLTFEAPEYSRLAGRFLAERLTEDVANAGILHFSDMVRIGAEAGIINERVAAFTTANQVALDAAIRPERDLDFDWFGIKTIGDRYLLRHPETRQIIETPQIFLLRVAVGVSDTLDEALELYEAFSTHDFLPSSPTLFNAGTHREQLSSCFLLDSPADDLRDIYKRYTDIAMLSKFAGGIGLAYHRIRCEGSLIAGTNGRSRGIVPFLKTLDASVAAVNQGGRRKGACSVYLEPWHADVERFLELRDNTGDEAQRTHNLNLANWIPDLFMRRVERDASWSLFDPKVVPQLCDTYGEAFEALYTEAERAGLAIRTVRARDLYGRMMRTLAQTGNGWMCFKDNANRTCNQTGRAGRVVHLSNLCTEILEVTDSDETAVCNLASINLARHVTTEGVQWDKLARTVRTAIRQLDRVIDRNLYTIPEARTSNMRWRPIGLGTMGMADVFFTLRYPFDSPEARRVSLRIAKLVYFHAVAASVELAEERGSHPTFSETRAAEGILQPDLWGVNPETGEDGADLQYGLFPTEDLYPKLDWSGLRDRVRQSGLRNSLLLAIAPTATIASILGCTECIEPQVSNLFKRETLSGEFLRVNEFLVADLRRLGLWTPPIRQQIKRAHGSIQDIDEIPPHLRTLYRTAWELSMRAVIDLAADRGAYLDQSQSLNLFQESPTIGQLSSMYMYAWKRGLKTTYYLRSRPATRIALTAGTPEAAVMCSLENPESCEACQ